VRPGPSGERVPRLRALPEEISLCEAASYRHRVLCIEGAVSYDNVASIIDWAPKVGLNGYFTQFRESYIFFERWYRHRNNPLKAQEPFSVDRARELLAGIEREVARRGLLYHAVGHGWTCEPFGIAGLGWDAESPALTAEARACLAEVDGVRDLWHGVPLNTNLCYSNPAVRARVVDSIVEYLQAHPQVHFLHFWLADGSNNQCECESCRAMRPSDWYVRMLNELDQRLTAAHLPARVVFLIYVDLLWPPERERIANPDRFVLMFAPITRSYRQTLTASPVPDVLPEYVRNRLSFPSDPGANVAFLRAWQRCFAGDSFDFDYHMWRGHYMDPGYMDISRVLAEDLEGLRTLGLNGYVSCQVQRAFFPNGLPMEILGRKLWQRDLPLAAIAEDYLGAAYGEEAGLAADYLTAVSQVFADLDAAGLARGARPDKALVARLRESLAVVLPAIGRNVLHAEACVAQSWVYLDYHRRLLTLVADILDARADGDMPRVEEGWQDLTAFVQAHEDALQGVFDGWAYQEAMRRVLGPQVPSA